MKKAILICCMLQSLSFLNAQTKLTDPKSGCQFYLPWNCEECTVRLQRSWTLLFGVIYKKIADLVLR